MDQLSLNIPSAAVFAEQRAKIRPSAENDAFQAEKEVLVNLSKQLLPKLIGIWSAHFDKALRADSQATSHQVKEAIKINDDVYNLEITKSPQPDRMGAGTQHDWMNNLKFTLINKLNSTKQLAFDTEGIYADGTVIKTIVLDSDYSITYDYSAKANHPAVVAEPSSFREDNEIITLHSPVANKQKSWLSPTSYKEYRT